MAAVLQPRDTVLPSVDRCWAADSSDSVGWSWTRGSGFHPVFLIGACTLSPTKQFQRYLVLLVPDILRLPHCKLDLVSVFPTFDFAFWFLRSAGQLPLSHWISTYTDLLRSPLQFSDFPCPCWFFVVFFFKFLECNVSRFQKEEKLNSGV